MNQKNNNNNYCTECGAKINGGNYCTECGAKINNKGEIKDGFQTITKGFIIGTIIIVAAIVIFIGAIALTGADYPDHTTEVNIDDHNFLIPVGYKETKDIQPKQPVKNQLMHVKWYENGKGDKIVVTVCKNEPGYKTTMPDDTHSNNTHTLKQYMEGDDCIYIHAPREKVDINRIAMKQ